MQNLREAIDIESSVVVGAEDMARAAAVSVIDVCQNATRGKRRNEVAVHSRGCWRSRTDAGKPRDVEIASAAAEVHMKSLTRRCRVAGIRILVRSSRTCQVVAEKRDLPVRKPEDASIPSPWASMPSKQFLNADPAM